MTLGIKDLKRLVTEGTFVEFTCYSKGYLWYKTVSGFEFPVPIEDTGDAIFLAKDRALLFMRYIRKHLENIEVGREEHETAGY